MGERRWRDQDRFAPTEENYVNEDAGLKWKDLLQTNSSTEASKWREQELKEAR